MGYVNYGVANFSITDKEAGIAFASNLIRSIIADKTGRMLNQVDDREQLIYLLRYAAHDQIGASTLVIEYEYIDRHYMEDYAEYYSRCFPRRSRKCLRLHFFSTEFGHAEFRDVLVRKECASENSDAARTRLTWKKLQDSYKGFCTIRPLPESYLGRVNLSVFPEINGSLPDRKVITKPCKISLFGRPLVVNAIGLREQDEAVSACATSAVWALLSGYGFLSPQQMPSLSRITKIAGIEGPGSRRIFPNTGLNSVQMSKCLQHFGLEPDFFDIRPDRANENETPRGVAALCKIADAYLPADIPFLVGGRLYKNRSTDDSPDLEYVGDHIVCVLGFFKSDTERKDAFPSASDRLDDSSFISEIYVHDDRYGQYLRLETKNAFFDPHGNGPEVIPLNIDRPKGLGISENADEFFEPTSIVLGLYHKIRLDFSAIHEVLDMFVGFLTERRESLKDDQARLIKMLINAVRSSRWSIQLRKSVEFKEDLTSNEKKSMLSSFGSTVFDVMTASFPRFVWVCTMYDEGRAPQMHMLFDATEIGQGNIFLGYVLHDISLESLWMDLNALACASLHSDQDIRASWKTLCEALPNSAQTKRKLRSIEFKLASAEVSLDLQFGGLKYPERNMKPGEVSSDGAPAQTDSLKVIGRHVQNWGRILDESVPYIWLIDKDGDLIIGEDMVDDVDGRLLFRGHPTLNDFRPSRVGGNLRYRQKVKDNVEEDGWYIDAWSGTYSQHLSHDKELRKEILIRVQKLRFDNFSSPDRPIKLGILF